MEKSKRRKIIIAILCATMLVVGTIVSIILLTQKKFDMTPTNTPTYNNHTTLTTVSPDSSLEIVENMGSTPKYYSNATVKVSSRATGNIGVYSYIDNKLIIPTSYASTNLQVIDLVANGKKTGTNIFRVGKSISMDANSNSLRFYTDKGKQIDVCNYNSDTNKNYGEIKQRIMDISEKRKGIKIDTGKKFETKKIEVTNVEYVRSYIKEGVYNYELWQLTDNNGYIYENLYELVADSERQLVQTINNPIGNNTDTFNNAEIFFLEDGTPRISITKTDFNTSTSADVETKTIYDINFKEKGSVTLYNQEYLSNMTRIGDIELYQYIKPCLEDKCDFAEIFEGETYYFQCETYSFNLKNGKFKEVDFDYVITESNTSFNSKLALLNTREISKKQLKEEKILLTNQKLETKELDYEINTITEITEDRFLVENKSGQYLIDNKYNQICYLGDYDSFFTTDNAVILTNYTSGYTYVVSLNGTIVKRYLSSEVTNINDSKYYMVSTQVTRPSKNEQSVVDDVYNEIYLEELGVRQNTPVYSFRVGAPSYSYNNTDYFGYNDTIIRDGISIITRIKTQSNNRYTYEFYTPRGALLSTLKDMETPNQVLTYWNYADDNHAIIYIASNLGGIGYTMVIDK